MKNERTKAWTQELRTTDAGQATRVLERFEADGTVSRCCLGVGCRMVEDMPTERYEHEKGFITLFDGNDVLPPEWWIDWLYGEEAEPGGSALGRDLGVDWPEGLADRDGYWFLKDEVIGTFAGLNDHSGLTFAQIADVVDYFGVRRTD